MVQSWEVNPTESKVTELIDVMKHLIDSTRIDTTINLDEALRQSCRSPAALPTVCPSVALLVAMRYIDRLKKVYIIIITYRNLNIHAYKLIQFLLFSGTIEI